MQRNLFPRIFRRAICFTLVLLMLTMSVACKNQLHTLTAENGNYTDNKTEITYTALPASYEPIARGEEYARIKLSGVTSKLYEIVDLSVTDYLCTDYGGVYYNQTVTPTLFADWTVATLQICTDQAIVTSHHTLTPADDKEAYVIASLQTAFCTGDDVRYPSYLTPERYYTLRFASEDVPGLYFTVKILQYSESVYGEDETELGTTFLYDRYTGRCVAVDDNIFRIMDGLEIVLPKTAQ